MIATSRSARGFHVLACAANAVVGVLLLPFRALQYFGGGIDCAFIIPDVRALMQPLEKRGYRNNLLADGSFENLITDGSPCQVFQVGDMVGAWTVRASPYTGTWGSNPGDSSTEVDDVAALWQAADGSFSADLSGYDAGGLFQYAATTPGNTYTLRYAVAANPETSTFYSSTPYKGMQVLIDGNVVDSVAASAIGHDLYNMGWTYYEFSFTAASESTRVEFLSTTPGQCGIVLDDVSLEERSANTPDAPTNLSATLRTDGGVDLAWSPGANSTATSLERSIDNGQSWAPLAALTAATASYTDAQVLAAGTHRIYRARGANDAGAGTASAPAATDQTISGAIAPMHITEGRLFSGTVATFTYSDPSVTSGFTASIDWGGGTGSSAAVVSTGNGTFKVTGSCVYHDDDPVPFSVSISGNDASLNLSTVLQVAPSPLDVAGLASGKSKEGQGYSGPIATFLDSDTAPVKPYLIDFLWSDGVHSTGQSAGGVGRQTINVARAEPFTERGRTLCTVTIRHGKRTVLAVGSVDVRDAVLNVSAQWPDAQLVAGTGMVGDPPARWLVDGASEFGSFTDPNPAAKLSDFEATLHWGDGAAANLNIAEQVDPDTGAKTFVFDIPGHVYDRAPYLDNYWIGVKDQGVLAGVYVGRVTGFGGLDTPAPIDPVPADAVPADFDPEHIGEIGTPPPTSGTGGEGGGGEEGGTGEDPSPPGDGLDAHDDLTATGLPQEIADGQRLPAGTTIAEFTDAETGHSATDYTTDVSIPDRNGTLINVLAHSVPAGDDSGLFTVVTDVDGPTMAEGYRAADIQISEGERFVTTTAPVQVDAPNFTVDGKTISAPADEDWTGVIATIHTDDPYATADDFVSGSVSIDGGSPFSTAQIVAGDTPGAFDVTATIPAADLPSDPSQALATIAVSDADGNESLGESVIDTIPVPNPASPRLWWDSTSAATSPDAAQTILLNNDDDAGDGNVDLERAAPTVADSDLVALHLQLGDNAEGMPANAMIVLTLNSGCDAVRVWQYDTTTETYDQVLGKGMPIGESETASWPVHADTQSQGDEVTMPDTLWVEGVALSDSAGAVEFDLAYSSPLASVGNSEDDTETVDAEPAMADAIVEENPWQRAADAVDRHDWQATMDALKEAKAARPFHEPWENRDYDVAAHQPHLYVTHLAKMSAVLPAATSPVRAIDLGYPNFPEPRSDMTYRFNNDKQVFTVITMVQVKSADGADTLGLRLKGDLEVLTVLDEADHEHPNVAIDYDKVQRSTDFSPDNTKVQDELNTTKAGNWYIDSPGAAIDFGRQRGMFFQMHVTAVDRHGNPVPSIDGYYGWAWYLRNTDIDNPYVHWKIWGPSEVGRAQADPGGPEDIHSVFGELMES